MIELILLLAMLWALLLLGSFLLLAPCTSRWWTGKVRKYGLLVVVGMALIVRLIPNLLLPIGAGYDIESYQIVGDLVLRGDDIYTSSETTHRHPYLPLQMYWLGFALWLARVTEISFVRIVRLAPIVADASIAGLLFSHLRRSVSFESALHGGLLYALNPISVFVSAYHGQFDAIPTWLLLLAVLTCGARLNSPLSGVHLAADAPPICSVRRTIMVGLRESSLWTGVWLGLGILNKSWPILAFPSFLVALKGWRGRLWYIGGVVSVLIVGVGVYLLLFRGQIGAMLTRVLGYNWGVGVWGYSYLFRLLSILNPGWGVPFGWLVHNGRYLTLAALGLAWLLRARKQPPAASVLTVLVAFLAVTHAFSIQYLVWIIPFAILVQDHKWLYRYTLGAFAYMLLAYTTLILDMRITQLLPWPQADWFIIMPAGLPAWLITVGWASRRLFFGERARGASYA